MKIKSMFLYLLAIGMSVARADATVIYVDASHTTGPQNGGDWANAFATLQPGINAASAGDTVWVAQGNYNPPNILVPFAMKEGVKIFGGFLNTHTSFSQRNFLTNVTRLQNNAAKVMYNHTALTHAAVLDGFTVTGGGNTANGGAIANDNCSPVFRNCRITSNVAGSGGGMANNASTGQICAPLIDGCIFDNNTASIGGGAISNTNCTPVISNCSFINNTRSMNVNFIAAGGAIYSYGSTVVISGCTFTGNTANGGTTQPMGGAIYNSNSQIILTNSSFTSNRATSPPGMNIDRGYGGAIYSYASGMQIADCSFITNGANSAGGAIYINASDADSAVTIDNCSFTGNTIVSPFTYIPRLGAGIYIGNAGPTRVTGCTFTGNNVPSEGMGGGIYIDAASPYLERNTFTANKAQYGGGIFNASATPEIRNSIFTNDTATHSGGAIFDSLSSPLLVNCLMYANVADSFGGAYYNHGSAGRMINTTLSQNTAFAGGAQYNVQLSAPRLLNSVVRDNTPGISNDAGSAPVAYYSLVQGYPADAAHHNIAGTADPLFSNAAAGDFTLQAGSPCINAGNNDSVPDFTVLDLAGHARIFAGTVDMGPYEVPLPPEVTLGSDVTICAGSSIILDAGNPGASYTWSNSDTTRTLTVTTAGAYSVTVTDSMGTDSDTINVSISALPVVNLGNDVTLEVGQTLTLDAGNPGATYLWSTGAVTQTIMVTSSGTYSVVVTNAAQCRGGDTITVSFTTGIAALAIQPPLYSVSPNPARNMVMLDVKDDKLLHTRVLLTDLAGRVLQVLDIEKRQQPISLADLAPGIYLLKPEGAAAIRIVKEQE